MGASEWTSGEHVSTYLSWADHIPHRAEGERALIDQLPAIVTRVLDLGTGDGRLLDLVLQARPSARAVCIDFSETMLAKALERFAGRDNVEIRRHDLERPWSSGEVFEAVVSSFAIHHLEHERKRSLYGEIYACLAPGGVFCNLEHVASPSDRLRQRFLATIQSTYEDASNKCLDVETQLRWLREIGFVDVDCHWKWLEFALLAGVKPDDPK